MGGRDHLSSFPGGRRRESEKHISLPKERREIKRGKTSAFRKKKRKKGREGGEILFSAERGKGRLELLSFREGKGRTFFVPIRKKKEEWRVEKKLPSLRRRRSEYSDMTVEKVRTWDVLEKGGTFLWGKGDD